MYILTGNDNEIIKLSETLEYQDNGNPLVDNGTLAIAKYLVKGIFDVKKVPTEVKESEYCYTEEDGFYKNPNYQPSMPSEEDRITDLEVAITELYEMMLGGN